MYTMNEWRAMQEELLEFFDRHGLNVAVGLRPGGGLAIRSQDLFIDATNIGSAYPQRENQ